MELSQLRAILALKDLASFARAGGQLHLSPPAVFGQIRQLEDETGGKLYERIGKRLELTESGRLLADYARAILAKHDEALLVLKDRSGPFRGVLRLGCGPHGSQKIVPHLFRAFLSRHPGVELRLTTGEDHALLRDLHSGVLDIVLMSLPAGVPELAEDRLWRYEMVLVLPGEESGVCGAEPSLDEIALQPFILYRRPVVIDDAVRRLCATLGFEPRTVMENDEPDSIKELVKLGLGVSILPMWSVAEDVQSGALRVFHPPVPQFHDYGMLYRNSDYRPRALKELADTAHRWQEWWPMARHVQPPG